MTLGRRQCRAVSASSQVAREGIDPPHADFQRPYLASQPLARRSVARVPARHATLLLPKPRPAPGHDRPLGLDL